MITFAFMPTTTAIEIRFDAKPKLGAPVNSAGEEANNGNAAGIIIGIAKSVQAGKLKQTLEVMTAGYVDLANAQQVYGGTYSDACKAALSGIIFCLNHTLPKTPDELPAVTTEDNGKVLKVTEGAWGAGAETAELPAVTAADNGKVLGVSGGAWGKVTPSGGGGGVERFVINLSDDGSGNLSIDKTQSQVVAAIEAGKIVVLSQNDEEEQTSMIFMLNQANVGYGAGDLSLYFSRCVASSGDNGLALLKFYYIGFVEEDEEVVTIEHSSSIAISPRKRPTSAGTYIPMLTVDRNRSISMQWVAYTPST